MSFQAKDSTVTFTWAISPAISPPVKADFDITLVLPNGTVTHVDDGITTYIAPTVNTQGKATFDLSLNVVGRYQVTLSIGTAAVYIVNARREIYSVIPPAVVLTGPLPQLTQGPTVIPPKPILLDISCFDATIMPTAKELDIDITNPPQGTWISPDGLHIFVGRSDSFFGDDGIVQWDLSTAFELSSATFVFDFDLTATGLGEDLEIITLHPNGTKLWITGLTTIEAFTFGTPWQVSTLTRDNVTYRLRDDFGSGNPVIGNGTYWNENGTELYVFWLNPVGIARWSASTAYDVSTLTFVDQTSDIFSAQGPPTTAHMSVDGKYWTVDAFLNFVLSTPPAMHQYTAGTPFDFSTLAYSGISLDYESLIPAVTTIMRGIMINTDYSKMYVVGSQAPDILVQVDCPPDAVPIVTLLDSGNEADFQQSFTMNSFTPTANSLILITISAAGAAPNFGEVPTIAPSNGTDWVVVDNVKQLTGDEEQTTVFRGMTGSPVAGAPVVVFPNFLQRAWMWSVHEISGLDASGTFGSGAIVQQNTLNSVNSFGVEVPLSFFADPVKNVAWLSSANFTGNGDALDHVPAGTIIELIDDVLIFGGTFGLFVGWQIGENISPGMTTNKSTSHGAIALELKAL